MLVLFIFEYLLALGMGTTHMPSGFRRVGRFWVAWNWSHRQL